MLETSYIKTILIIHLSLQKGPMCSTSEQRIMKKNYQTYPPGVGRDFLRLFNSMPKSSSTIRLQVNEYLQRIILNRDYSYIIGSPYLIYVAAFFFFFLSFVYGNMTFLDVNSMMYSLLVCYHYNTNRVILDLEIH